MSIDVSLNFMPAFYAKHLGLSYGEEYYFDPRHRADVERREGRFLHDILGHRGVSSTHPEPSPNLFIQPVDLVMRTQGAEWRFPRDGTVESCGTPWAGLTPAEIAAIDAEAAARHPVIDRVLAQYEELRAMYGERADLFGLKSGTMTIHTPYTTAHQLCGAKLLELLLLDPEGASTILAKVADIYHALFRRITARTGARIERIQLGDCAASMLSEATYRARVLPSNAALAAAHGSAGYHSCGPSSHLLSAFAELPGMDSIQLGPGTNIARAAALMPGTRLEPLVDPLIVRNGTPSAVADYVDAVQAQASPAPAVILCAWSFDRETPVGNVDALYSVVEDRLR